MLTEMFLSLVDEEMIVDFVERKGVLYLDKFDRHLSQLELFFRQGCYAVNFQGDGKHDLLFVL
jgi:hypothetical protein